MDREVQWSVSLRDSSSMISPLSLEAILSTYAVSFAERPDWRGGRSGAQANSAQRLQCRVTHRKSTPRFAARNALAHFCLTHLHRPHAP